MKFPDWLPVYGDTSYRGKCPSESVEQISFVNWVRQTTEHGDLIIHVRNEGKRTHSQTQRHKVEGMCPGAADIIIPGKPTFVCEMKKQDHTKSRWQDGQQEFLRQAQVNGAFVCIALGNEGAKQAYREWLKN